jgi:hypothetical protein
VIRTLGRDEGRTVMIKRHFTNAAHRGSSGGVERSELLDKVNWRLDQQLGDASQTWSAAFMKQPISGIASANP